MSTVIVIPVLGRPHRVDPLLTSTTAATPEPHRVLFVGTEGDDDEIEALEKAKADYVLMPPTKVGDYAKKINYAYQITDEPFLFLGADDLLFHPGWLSAALEPMSYGRIGVVGTQDLGSPRVLAGEHSTHFLVRRTYIDQFGTIDEPGKILHEGYAHEFVDDEFIATARKRGAYAFANDSVVEHLHPDWGKAALDPLYRARRARWDQGIKVLRKREKLWKSQ